MTKKNAPELKPVEFLDLSKAPLPTPAMLRYRQGLIRQFGRFLGLNGRIMKLVITGKRNEGKH